LKCDHILGIVVEKFLFHVVLVKSKKKIPDSQRGKDAHKSEKDCSVRRNLEGNEPPQLGRHRNERKHIIIEKGETRSPDSGNQGKGGGISMMGFPSEYKGKRGGRRVLKKKKNAVGKREEGHPYSIFFLEEGGKRLTRIKKNPGEKANKPGGLLEGGKRRVTRAWNLKK